MDHTVKHGHFAEPSPCKVGDIVTYGTFLGVLGDTGASDGVHLHIDATKGINPFVWTLANMSRGIVPPAPKELNYYIDESLLNAPYRVTAYYNDYRYQQNYKIEHPGYDIVGKINGIWSAYWNRTFPGEILVNTFHPGYGNVIITGVRT